MYQVEVLRVLFLPCMFLRFVFSVVIASSTFLSIPYCNLNLSFSDSHSTLPATLIKQRPVAGIFQLLLQFFPCPLEMQSNKCEISSNFEFCFYLHEIFILALFLAARKPLRSGLLLC